jgi:hypothetical protein
VYVPPLLSLKLGYGAERFCFQRYFSYYCGHDDGPAILPAAIGNVLTVEILNLYLHTSISYFRWLWLAFPIWLLLIPAVWYIIRRTYPAKIKEIPGVQEVMESACMNSDPLPGQKNAVWPF